MRAMLCFQGSRPRNIARCLVLFLCLLMCLGPAAPAMAASGDVRTNGTTTQPAYLDPASEPAAGLPQNFFTGVGFLFEPESPYASLKEVPEWQELEQLLDNPYAVVYDPNTPGNFDGFPSYRSTITRRPGFLTPGSTLQSPGPALPAFLVHGLNYNPTDGEEMRLLNPGYPGGTFQVPYQLYQDLVNDPTGNRWAWTYQTVNVSPGAGRVDGPEIDYNGPLAPDPDMCVTNLELVPPEGTQLCGHDPGEPSYPGFGVNSPTGYSTPAIPGVLAAGTPIPSASRLFDPTRGTIQPRNATTGAGGLMKPSLRIPENGGTPANPNYLLNIDPNNTTPSTENDYYRAPGTTVNGIPSGRTAAIVLGKALFWDMQVGSDGVQSCGTCHFTGAGTDTRVKNQINPNHLGGDLVIDLHGSNTANQTITAADFPLHKLTNPDIAGDPACTTPIVANVTNVTPALDHPVSGDVTVCSSGNIVNDVNDVVSSMGVIYGLFADIPTTGGGRSSPAFVQLPGNAPRPLMPDFRGSTVDPIPVFQGFRRVEPRNTPTMQAAGFNFDNFWDGRARHDYNGGSVFGSSDPQSHVWVNNGTAGGTLTATRQIIKFASIASLSQGPALSEFEMSFQGRNWQKIGKKLLQNGVVPLANQLVDPTDSVLGPYSGQRSTIGGPVNRPGTTGLNVTYEQLVQAAYRPQLWANQNQHLNGCYTDGNPALHPNQCAAGSVSIPVLDVTGNVVNSGADPFDGFVLQGPVANGALPTNTNQFRQMEANFSMFWGLAVHAWVQLLVPDDTPFDKWLEQNPDAFLSLGDSSERLLVDDLLNCVVPAHRNPVQPGFPESYACFTEVGNFKRDTNAVACIHGTAEGGTGCTEIPSPGTRTPNSNQTDPLLGMDIFFASNLSLKNPNFRSARCGACHNMPTLTDHTVPFTFKAQLPDFASEFSPATPGVELLIEPLGRDRLISGFLLESEISENGQDAVERRFMNQSIAPNPADGYAYPDGVFNPLGADGISGTADDYKGAGQAYIDNGVYNLGVRPIGNDIGRGGPDAFGWPLSLAEMLLKNLGGTDFQPGNPMMTFDPDLGPEGGLFEESAQDQSINPGGTDEPVAPQMPPYNAPFMPGITVGDSQPELDEPFAGINTLTDVAMLEGFIDVIGPVSPSAVKNEALNNGETELMGTWPVPNRVLKDGAFKAPQLRNIELTGPYFHNGGMLTLRQVVDFYTRGGDFPITNAAHRDFLLTNLNIEAQSNLSEDEKVALVDFLLELTDDRVKFQRGPFDHPEVIVPLDGKAPDNTFGRPGLIALTTGVCPSGTGPCFMDVPAVGTNGDATPQLAFLGINNVRLVGPAAFCGPAAYSQYCH